jgi:hypothetical protein
MSKSIDNIYLTFIPPQLEGEPDEAYEGFVRYCLLGSGRTVKKAVEDVRTLEEKTGVTKVNKAKYDRHSTEFEWGKRVRKFDNLCNNYRSEQIAEAWVKNDKLWRAKLTVVNDSISEVLDQIPLLVKANKRLLKIIAADIENIESETRVRNVDRCQKQLLSGVTTGREIIGLVKDAMQSDQYRLAIAQIEGEWREAADNHESEDD